MTIDDLRKWLKNEEEKWTENDDKFLGAFGQQQICLPRFQWNEDAQASDFKGWDHDVNIFWDVSGLGIFMDCKDVPNKE